MPLCIHCALNVLFYSNHKYLLFCFELFLFDYWPLWGVECKKWLKIPLYFK